MLTTPFNYLDSFVVWLNSKGLSRMWLLRIIMVGIMYLMINRAFDPDWPMFNKILDLLVMFFVMIWICMDEIFMAKNVDVANSYKVMTRSTAYAFIFLGVLGALSASIVIGDIIKGEYLEVLLQLNYYSFFWFFYTVTPKDPPHKYTFNIFKTSEA